MDFKEQFIKQGVYLRGWSKKTVRTYRQGLNALQMALGEYLASELTKTHLEAFVIWLKERGLSPGGCNMYIRTVNSFLSWLLEQEILKIRLRIKQLPDPKKPLQGFSDAEIRQLLSTRPKGFLRVRTWTLINTLMDTGCRIDELLNGLTMREVDLDNLQLTVTGNRDRSFS